MLALDRSAFLKLLVLVNLTARPFGRLYARRYKITLAEWRVMFTVAGRPGAAASEIAEMLGLDKMAVSRAIRALERSGNLKRTTDGRGSPFSTRSPPARSSAKRRCSPCWIRRNAGRWSRRSTS